MKQKIPRVNNNLLKQRPDQFCATINKIIDNANDGGSGGGGGDITVVQTTGTSTTDVMSQNAVTESLNNKVTRVTGKGLSSNDFTDALKNKLESVDPSGEENVIETVKRNTITLPVTNKTVNVTVPEETSDLINDSDFVSDANYVHTDQNFSTSYKSKLDGIEVGAEKNLAHTVTDSAYVHTDNNYTSTEKNKLASIESGAEANVNADWNATSGDAEILNKPTIGDGELTLKRNGTVIGSFNANSTTSSAVDITVPTKTSDITNDSNFPVDADYVHTDNNYTTAEKTKLAGIETGAEVNDPDTVIDSDYVHTDNNYTTAEKTKLAGIEAGAQVNAANTVIDANYVHTDNNYTTAEKTDVAKIDGIEDVIPTQASSSNQLADKAFVNSSLNSVTAYYITKNAAGEQFNTKAELDATTTFYSGGVVRVLTRNDYCVVLADETKTDPVTGESPTTRYIYQNGTWEFQYVVNKTSLTAVQLAAINSGITAAGVSKLNGIEAGAQVNDPDTVIDSDYVHTDNNYTTAEKTKLAGVESGAEVNVNADWNAVSGDAEILNKPTIPTATSDLTNDSNFVSDSSYVHTDNNYTSAEKTKLAGIDMSTKQDTLTAGSNIQINGSTISATDTTYTAGTGISISDGVISNTQTSANWGNITGTLSNQTDLQNALNAKQETLTAGSNININAGTISATDTTYTAGTGININNGVISATAAQQQQSDWTQTDTTAVDYIKNKPENVTYWDNVGQVQTPTPWIETTDIVDEAVTADKIDFTTLLKNLPIAGRSFTVWSAGGVTGWLYRVANLVIYQTGTIVDDLNYQTMSATGDYVPSGYRPKTFGTVIGRTQDRAAVSHYTTFQIDSSGQVLVSVLNAGTGREIYFGVWFTDDAFPTGDVL